MNKRVADKLLKAVQMVEADLETSILKLKVEICRNVSETPADSPNKPHAAASAASPGGGTPPVQPAGRRRSG